MFLAHPTRRTGHFQIESARGDFRVIRAEPVGHDDAIVFPFAFEDLKQGVIVFAGIGPIDTVVGGHHRPGIRIADRDAERLQIDFAQGAFVHFGTHREAFIFLIVGHEMLDARADAFALDPLDVGRCQHAAEERVFGITFEVASCDGRAMDVDRGGKQDMRAFGFEFIAEHIANFFNECRDSRWRRAQCRPAWQRMWVPCCPMRRVRRWVHRSL